MKSYIYGILVTALVVLTACETVQPCKEMIFTATIASDTKASVLWSDNTQTYKTLWTKYDRIFIYDQTMSEWVTFEIVDGLGTTTAKFRGLISPQETYVAVHGNSVSEFEDMNNPSIYLYSYHYNNVDELNSEAIDLYNQIPMVARSNSQTLNFKNMCSLLHVCLTGNGEKVSEIKFQSHESGYGAGSLDIYFDGDEPHVDANLGYTNPISLYVSATLSSTPKEFYMVIPYGNYYDGFDISVITDKGTMTKSTYEEVVFERSQARKVILAFEL